jgi:hypothetical protein
MTDREKYLFDLQGFLRVPDFLTPEEVARLNEAFDANRDKMGEDGNSATGNSKSLPGTHKRGLFSGMLTWEQPWCQPFRDLLVHQKAIPYLNTLLGRGWRMDHSPFALFSTTGAEGLLLHGSGNTVTGEATFQCKNGQMRCGMIVLQFALADQNEGDGGVCCVAGSHKSNFHAPREIMEWDSDQEIVTNIPCKTGDMVIFSESTTHGTLPWRASHERRALLYRYSPKYLHYAGGYHQTTFPEWVNELTEAQRSVLEPPYIYNRPLIEDDGETVTRPRWG